MALYNNGYPMTYPQMYYQMPTGGSQMPQQPTQQGNNGIIWVQGEAGAKSYLVAPNNTVQLWDSESQTIYLKSADASGMPSMRILDYTIRDQEQRNLPVQQAAQVNYATMQDIEELRAQINSLSKQIKEAKHEPIIQRNAEQ